MGVAGAIIRRMRKRKGLTQENLADLFYTTQERISRIETGKVQLTADEFIEMRRTLSNIQKVASFTIDTDERGKMICRTSSH